MISWTTSAGSKAYSLQGIHKAGDASSDAEIRSILTSFHLLSAPPASTPGNDQGSTAYQVGRLMGSTCGCLGFIGLLILAGLGIFWLIRRMKRQPPGTSVTPPRE